MMTETTVTEPTRDELQAELDRVRDVLKKVNAESAGRRKKLEQLDAEQAAREKADLTQEERFKGEIETLQAAHNTLADQLKAERIRSAVIAKAQELGFATPGDAYALLDLSEVETSKDGKVTGFEKSLETLAESGRLSMQKVGDGIGTPPKIGGKFKVKKEGAKQAEPHIRL